MPTRDSQSLIITLPSKGILENPTLQFMENCGLPVYRTNPRQYEAGIIGEESIKVRFQRAADIPSKVNEGSADLGVTGLDIQKEYQVEDDKVIIICEDLGYGKCDLVLAVPEDWVDVTSVSDLADLSVLWHDKGKDLRIATAFPNQTRKFLYEKGVYYFSLAESHGALESAPRMGYADIISDLTTTGTTLRENRLRPIRNGTILPSQACLIGNRGVLKRYPEKLRLARIVIESFESRSRANEYFSIVANIQGNSPEEIAKSISTDIEVAGLQGPTISKVYPSENGKNKNWYAVNVVVKTENLFKAIERLRKASGSGILVSPVEYIFESKSLSYDQLLTRLGISEETPV